MKQKLKEGGVVVILPHKSIASGFSVGRIGVILRTPILMEFIEVQIDFGDWYPEVIWYPPNELLKIGTL